ncbi:MAG TPA: serine/threonine-protein kinase [Candidatus Eisenbacteria bacterium]|nr:serine/threonine-protein kinase [Candidatus Eisenbacteria bacterium]
MTPHDDTPEPPSRTWNELQALFHELAALPGPGREARLAELARDDPARAREVLSLLDAHAASGEFLEDPPIPAAPSPAMVGQRLGPYRIVGEIGRGGMGVVYRAERDDAEFSKQVAIKLIEPGMRSHDILRRFNNERQILAMLEHPHIARLLDGGTAPDGGPYIVMEYVSGQPLLGYCDERRLGLEARLALFLTVCDAVQFAHQRLVVHRDLKSDNVLVTPEGSPRLLDFGIAKLITPDTGEATVTMPMHRMLTPDYASPEQIRGEPATVASDIYSLGVILYELMCGERPHRFTTTSPDGASRVLREIDPVRPSTAIARAAAAEVAERRGETIRRLARRLAGDLDFIVLKALEYDPTRRYGSVEQFARDLRRHLDGRPVLARGRFTLYRTSRFLRRNRAGVIAGALVTGALIAGLVGTAWQARIADRERDLARRRFDESRGLTHAVMFDIHDAIAPLPGSTRARELLVQHAIHYLDGLSRDARGDASLERELALAYAKIGDVQGRPLFPNLGRAADALRSYDQALQILSGLSAAQPESLAIFHDWIVVVQRRADLLDVLGRHREALAQAVDARERVERALARRRDDAVLLADLCISCDHLVDLRLNAADTLGAISECTTNLVLAEQDFRRHPRDAGARRGALIACTKMANLRGMRGDRDSAQVFFRRGEELASEALATQPNNTEANRDLSIVYTMHGLFLAGCGAIDSALAVYGHAQQIAEMLAAADTNNALVRADVADGHLDLGNILMKGRRFPEAERRFRAAYEGFAKMAAADTGNSENRVYMARSSRGVGEASRELSRQAGSAAERARWRAQALAWFTRSLELYRGLVRAGALNGEDTRAPNELGLVIAKLRGPHGG